MERKNIRLTPEMIIHFLLHNRLSVGGIKMFQDNFINQMIRLILKELKGEKQYARIASVMYP
ncbi:hypothetical protein, partial [uncultured Bacteroides sp.]|uniref:hypothetical protein n=1 Tax=uncultured Bacteroides sp. TaxID=162156 RepID=UPI00260DC3C5